MDVSTLSPEERAVYDGYITRELPDGTPLPMAHERVRTALRHEHERQRLGEVREQIDYLKANAERAITEAQTLSAHAGQLSIKAMYAEQAKVRAEESLQGYTHRDGSIRGFHLKLPFGFEWKSKTRRVGEELSAQKHHAEVEGSLFQKHMAEAAHGAEVRAREASHYAHRHDDLSAKSAQELEAAYGQGTDFEVADRILSNSVHRELSEHEIEQEGAKVTLPAITGQECYADFVNGNLDYLDAKRACELLNEPGYAEAVEQWHVREQEWEEQQEGGYSL